ncbi:hypothetical protein SCHPADRAFT_387050 [Schizopora paradoxa]|uniref:Uncharacterized protein n=1 Tax=Schizopora paradoxa TaxID=27342 RepID=A0A0H2S7Z9_9AGAM|nr:hypothetical protein SCHPADRAFT_387050 [Schizopora paradoxa]
MVNGETYGLLQPFSLARGIALFCEPFGASRTRSEQSGLKLFRDRRPKIERSARIRSLGKGYSRVPSRRNLRKEECRVSRHLLVPFYGVRWLCQTARGPFDPGAGNFAFPRASEKGCKNSSLKVACCGRTPVYPSRGLPQNCSISRNLSNALFSKFVRTWTGIAEFRQVCPGTTHFRTAK